MPKHQEKEEEVLFIPMRQFKEA
ncbi:MAG: hypothetical protein HW403_444, partial [Dehalococcoidia bacterium]|nr:hypothetical protein [Dehalococcoidia bacterium]